MANTNPTDLFAFGNRKGPRPPRLDRDIFPEADGMLDAQTEGSPQGASAFADPTSVPLTGHFHRLTSGTPLPEGLGIIADGVDVDADSPNLPTHHTIFPTRRMSTDEFERLLLGLPWKYEGKK